MKIFANKMDLKSTLLSGQCFRITEEENGSFTCILSDRVINVKQDDDYLEITSNKQDNLLEVVINYFDLETDYNEYINYLSEKDNYLKEISNKCSDYKILRQDKFEMFISYIISQNNNVKRISNSIEKLSKMAGEKIIWNNKEYYLFPTPENLMKLSIEDIRSTGVGFRDKYIISALEKIKEDNLFLDKIYSLNTEDALKELISIKGIGLKVASCILLFGYYRLDVFPIDTWVIKNISLNYPEISPIQKEIEKFARNKFGKYSGLAIQYMFHYERNKKSE